MTLSQSWQVGNPSAFFGGMATPQGLQAYDTYLYNNYQTVNGTTIFIAPDLSLLSIGKSSTGNSSGINVLPAATPPQFRFTFDTIGQTIFRSIGHCRLPLRVIWAQGINESGDVSISNTQTFAAALCAPIDPLEDGEIFAIWDGGSQIFNTTGAVTPAGWSPTDAALLATSLANMVIFPGDESQLPASLIVADKGADKTNAFRGIRYIIFPDYPIGGGSGSSGGGLPQLSAGYQRTSDGGSPSGTFTAVDFFSGAG